jgi:hypothetical protein
MYAAKARPRSALMLALPLGVLLASTVYLCCRARRYFSDEGSYCTVA